MLGRGGPKCNPNTRERGLFGLRLPAVGPFSQHRRSFMRALFGMNLRRRGLRAGGRRVAGLLVALLLGLFMLPGAAMAQPTSEARAAMPDEPVQTEVRNVLSQYGRFVQHA